MVYVDFVALYQLFAFPDHANKPVGFLLSVFHVEKMFSYFSIDVGQLI